mmetsp:Transcript_6978/g.17070  ORF Transcript_6978/g.17070 Transcript_6978/m.17070 type:complete len:202 (+) Transcript_6978:2711-3316(+)
MLLLFVLTIHFLQCPRLKYKPTISLPNILTHHHSKQHNLQLIEAPLKARMRHRRTSLNILNQHLSECLRQIHPSRETCLMVRMHNERMCLTIIMQHRNRYLSQVNLAREICLKDHKYSRGTWHDILMHLTREICLKVHKYNRGTFHDILMHHISKHFSKEICPKNRSQDRRRRLQALQLDTQKPTRSKWMALPHPNKIIRI